MHHVADSVEAGATFPAFPFGAATFPTFPNTQETRQLLAKYGGKFDYDVDLEHVEGTGLDSISALAQLL